jgi:hypothetical protein
VYTLVSAPSPSDVSSEAAIEEFDETPEIILSAKHQYIDGIHTIAGVSEVPTRCHRLITEPFFVGGMERVEIRFNTLLEGEACPSEYFEVPFRVSFEAPENIDISATWNGDTIRLNLIPLQPGETLEDEIYIKG